MNKKLPAMVKTLTTGIAIIGFLNACKPQTSNVSVLVIEDATKSFKNDSKSVKLSERLCSEVAREIPFGSKIGKIEVTSVKAIPTAWTTLTSRRTAQANCHQKTQPVAVTNTPPGTFACQGAETAIEMVKKTQTSVLLILHIQATELENRSCPDVWQNLGQAIADGQMVMILSAHPLGQKLNQEVYQALKTQENIQFCKPEQAVDCVNKALEILKHSPSHASQI